MQRTERSVQGNLSTAIWMTSLNARGTLLRHKLKQADKQALLRKAALEWTMTILIKSSRFDDLIRIGVLLERHEVFMQDADYLTYENDNSTVLNRKKGTSKSISLTFQNQRFGGTVERDWEQHCAYFEAIVLHYQLRRKNVAYYLRLRLQDQKLSLRRSLFPSKVKTYGRLCAFDLISEIDIVAITTDVWTAESAEGFISFTKH